MLKRQGQADVTDAEVLSLREPLSEFVSAWVSTPDAADDVVQETLTRVLECRSRLEPGTLRAYAVAVARNLIISELRADDIGRRHRHRLVEPATTEPVDDAVLKQQEWAALATAFARLPEHHQKLLFAHEVLEEDTGKLAYTSDTNPGAIAAALARARARLRLEYLLAFRRVRLPTARCRPVLQAIAMGDRRRQRVLDTGQHLLSCPVCAGLAPALQARERPLWGLAAPAWLMSIAHRIRQGVKNHPVQTTIGTAVAGAIVVIARCRTSRACTQCFDGDLDTDTCGTRSSAPLAPCSPALLPSCHYPRRTCSRRSLGRRRLATASRLNRFLPMKGSG
jgi:RNA polymerase sigma factor (sigma-70 family)